MRMKRQKNNTEFQVAGIEGSNVDVGALQHYNLNLPTCNLELEA